MYRLTDKTNPLINRSTNESALKSVLLAEKQRTQRFSIVYIFYRESIIC